MLGVVVELVQRTGINLPFPLNYHAIKVGSIVAAAIMTIGFSGRVKEMLEQYKSGQENLLKANLQKIETLQRADDLKEEFIANVSHELRTPLTGIIGLSDIMLGRLGDTLSAHDRETLTMIKVSGQRLANLINDVVDISAIKDGNLELHRSTVDLKAICKLIANMSRPFIGIKKIELLESYPNEPVMVDGDEDRLQQILFNLVSNAIKFTVKGSVTLRLEIIEGNARVAVQDTGIGISKDEQKKIFNRFYQVDSAESRQQGGTGLGLAITNKLADLHGTELMLDSAAGEGSTFYFELPMVSGSELKAVEPEESRQQKNAEKRSAMMQMAEPIQTRRAEQREARSEKIFKVVSGKGRKILIVDDEYLNLRIVQEHLAADYELMLALSAHEALEIIAVNTPDLIITDLMMPVMDGFELCAEIRKKYRLDELPIIILTARNRVEDLVQGMSVGANDYISKPFSKEELKIRINKQFELLQLMEIQKENQRLYWQLEKYQATEKHLRERENRFAKMLDVTGDAMLCIDESGLIIHLNRSAETLFGVKELDFQDKSLNIFNKKLKELSVPLATALKYPFDEQKISTDGATNYFDFSYNSDLTIGSENPAAATINVCILPLSLEQELYLLLFNTNTVSEPETGVVQLSTSSLPEIISEINKNVERTQILRNYLNQITPEDLQNHQHLFEDLANVDEIIKHISAAIHDKSDDDMQYRETLVKLMQDCQYYWQKVTGQSIIELAEKSRIWTVSIDNGRLRTRSMNRYLALDKLPENPRWRQVARTAYFVLSKVSHDQEAKQALEKGVTQLQDIVEAKALN